MARIESLNRAIAKEFPDLDIKAVAGRGYVYFDGGDGFDKVESLMIHLPSLDTEKAKKLVIGHIRENVQNNQKTPV
jgi:hypothetical protein